MLSDRVETEMQQVPHRPLFNALGPTPEEMKRPLVGIISSYNEIMPGHMSLDKIVDVVKLGVAEAGGMPVVMPAIAVCNGIAMGHTGVKYSLVTRDLIADSTEYLARTHRLDAMVCVPNYDKNVPSLLVAAAYASIPTIFVNGGPILVGRVKSEERSLPSMFEAIGVYATGKMTADDVAGSEEKVCPTCGSRSNMYTANSLNCLTEMLGVGLRGNGMIPAVYLERLHLAKHVGNQIMELCRKDIRPHNIMTEDAFMNVLTTDMAPGCSTNTMLHLPAVAREVGVNIDVNVANEVSTCTPSLCHLASAGHTYMEDLSKAGDVYAVMGELSKKNLINLGCLTATGKTVGENIEYTRNLNPEVIRPVEEPYSATGNIAVLNSSITPGSCVARRSAVTPEMLKHSGSARISDCKDDTIMAIRGGKTVPSDTVVIRYEGPKDDPGMREMLSPTSAIVNMGLGSTVALITGGRFSGASHGASIGRVAPEVVIGGPIALIREGDIIDIDIDSHTLNMHVSEEEFTERKRNWKPRVNEMDGYLVRYRGLVTGAPQSATLSVEGWYHS